MLTRPEIYKLVNDYIGVSGGYLGDFSYRTHEEFYMQYCDLDINPNNYTGTTRERFIQILSSSNQVVQAKIVKGILEKYPVTNFPENEWNKKQKIYDSFQIIIKRLESGSPVENPILKITSDVVDRAISDAETLIKESGATSGIDRIHTVLHGYLLAVCKENGIDYGAEPNLTYLFKILKENHPNLKAKSTRGDDIEKILRSISAILDALNPIRNKASVAHPNEDLLGEDEAMLVINTSRTLLHYLDNKFAKK